MDYLKTISNETKKSDETMSNKLIKSNGTKSNELKKSNETTSNETTSNETKPTTQIPIPTFKILFIGDGGVGKTTLIKRHSTGQFDPKYISTLGVDVTPLLFNTSYGPVIFNIWDCAGQAQYSGLGDGYYIRAQGAVYMFDLTSITTFQSLLFWKNSVDRITGITGDATSMIPSVVVGNKCDLPTDTYEVSDTQKCNFIHQTKLPYFDVSAKSNYNYDKPFLYLARQLLFKPDLEFISTQQLPIYEHISSVVRTDLVNPQPLKIIPEEEIECDHLVPSVLSVPSVAVPLVSSVTVTLSEPQQDRADCHTLTPIPPKKKSSGSLKNNSQKSYLSWLKFW
jgi:GTP-binding nuclear protein Ran